MAHEMSRGLGSLSAQFRMNEEIVTMPLPSNFELLHHHHDGRAGCDPTNQDDARYTSCCAGQHETLTEQGPLALLWWDKDESVDPHHLCHRRHHYHHDCDTTKSRSSTSRTSSDLKTKVRARNANIVRRALQLSSNDDCQVDTTAIMTPKKKKVLSLQPERLGRGREANHHHGDQESTSGEGNLEHSFHLSALASALPLYDLGDELWQSELSYLFGPMGPAFAGRGGERTKTKNGRKRELPLVPDTETFGQQGSNPNYDTTGELSIDKTTSGSSTTRSSSSTTFPSSLNMQGENTRHYDQEPQEVVERSDVKICLSESSMIVVTPLKRQRRITSISPTTSKTGKTGLRRASMNFNDLPSL